jgi:eukaryotic-like serine/threonine-protein kinase
VTPKDWERLKPLFEQALSLPPEERATFIAKVRLDDDELGRNLADLLGEEETGALSTGEGDPFSENETKTINFSGMPRVIAGRFRVLRRVGKGGMGEVFEVEDLQLKDRVALKTIRPDIASDSMAVDRFKREILLGKRIAHPNVCRIHDLGTGQAEDGTELLFLTMEFLSGETLASRITRAPLTPAEALPLIENMAAGLTAAHEAGIVHRDFKSGNVMLVPRNGRTEAVIMDLGLARETGPEMDGSPGLTATGIVMGTPGYMAPEQFQGKAATCATDIYALGVVLYEMVTGSRPMEAVRSPAVSTKAMRKYVDASAIRPEVPRTWDAVIGKCLEFDPERRFQSCVEVADALRIHSFGGKQVKRFAVGAIVAAILAASAAVGLVRSPMLHRPGSSGPPSIAQARTLAVLPFENGSNDAATQAYCDGLLETVASAASETGALKSSFWVVPASEVRHDRIRSIQEARKAFNVNLVMSGRVVRIAGGLQVTLSLSDAKSMRQLESRVLQFREDEPSGSQGALLAAVFELLELQMQPDAARLMNAGTKNSRAFHLYLEGQGYLRRFDGPPSIDKAVSILEEAVRLDPTYSQARSSLAEAYYHEFEATKDAAWLARADSESTRAVELNGALPQVHTTLGMIARGTGRYEQAAGEFRKAIELDPSNFEAQRLLARTYEDMGRESEAEDVFLAAIRSKPSYWPTNRSLGLFYFRRGDYAKAEPWLKLVTELVPENAGGFLNLGILYYSTGRYDEATLALKKSIAIGPLPEAYTNLGTVQFFQRHYTDSVVAFEKAVEMGPNNPYYWGNLADSYRQISSRQQDAAGAYRKAIQLANHLLAINPNDGNLRSSLALYLAKSGDKQNSLNEISRALKLASKNVNIAFNAAQVYEIAGDRAAAIHYLKDALDRGYPVDEARNLPEFSGLRSDPSVVQLLSPSGNKTRR